MHTSLEGGSSKSTKVGHHAATQIDDARVPCGSHIAQSLPDAADTVKVLVGIGWSDADGDSLFKSLGAAYQWQAMQGGVFIGIYFS